MLERNTEKRHNNVRLRNKIEILNIKIGRLQEYYKELHYKAEFENCDSPKKASDKINKLLGKEKKGKEGIIIRGEDGVLIESSSVAQYLNDHFSTIGTKLSEKIAFSPQASVNRFKTMKVSPTSLFFDVISEEDIVGVISSLKNDKAPGVDGIPVIALKCLASAIIPFLCDIFNGCLINGIYLEELKTANVTAVFKSDSCDAMNYRPISVLTAINKIFEKLICKNVLEFLNHNGFFSQGSMDLELRVVLILPSLSW